eukprot:gene6528-4704_t
MDEYGLIVSRLLKANQTSPEKEGEHKKNGRSLHSTITTTTTTPMIQCMYTALSTHLLLLLYYILQGVRGKSGAPSLSLAPTHVGYDGSTSLLYMDMRVLWVPVGARTAYNPANNIHVAIFF